MKIQKILIPLLILCLLCALFTSCSGESQGSSVPSSESEGSSSSEPAPSSDSSSEPSESSDPSGEADTETAMNNFLKKLEAGDYTIATEGVQTVTVCSPDLVYYTFDGNPGDDYAVMTLNGEVFTGRLGEDTVTGVEFLPVESAIAAVKAQLPNNWLVISNGNIYELFYNDTENPLRFVSYEDSVKKTIMSLVGYGQAALEVMHEVYMTLDAEDPTSVHFEAVVDDIPAARMEFDDVDMTLKFGGTQSDPRIDNWLNNPVYPETKTEWSESDLFFLNSVFFPGFGDDALPFPDFASYALTIDKGVFEQSEEIYLSDAHATEADVEAYIALLKEKGFAEAENRDGETVLMRPLREDYLCSIEANAYYDNGLVLEAGRYYDYPMYEGLEEINAALAVKGYPELPESEHLFDWTAADTWSERSESWLYFFDYDFSLMIRVRTDDPDAFEEYMQNYEQLIMNTEMTPSYMGAGEDEGEVVDYYASANGEKTFRYNFDGGENVTLQFRNEKHYSAEELSKKITDAGIIPPVFQGVFSSRDITRYHHYTRGFEGLYLAVSQQFDTADGGENYLNEYVPVLEEAGYERTNPEFIGSLKQNAYYNAEEDRFVAFDVFPLENGSAVNFDFVWNNETEEE